MRLNAFGIVCLVLVVIGALNWGAVGLAGVDLVAAIFGAMSPVSRAVYVLVGLAGIGLLIAYFSNRGPVDRT